MGNSGLDTWNAMQQLKGDSISHANTLEVGLNEAYDQSYPVLIDFLILKEIFSEERFNEFVRYMNNNIRSMSNAIHILKEWIFNDKLYEQLEHDIKVSIEVTDIRKEVSRLILDTTHLTESKELRMKGILMDFYQGIYEESYKIYWRNKVTRALQPVVFGV